MKKSLGPKTIVYPTPVFIIGTYDKTGKPNAMTAAWAGICCSKPPCVAISLQRPRYSYGNIMERGAFTVNIPTESHVEVADYFGIVSGRDTDKFAVSGLTPVRGEFVDAPYIQEFPFSLECKVLHTIEIGVHVQFIGEILDIKTDESVLGADGQLDIRRVHPLLYAPGDDAYFGIGSYCGKAFSIGERVNTTS
jgi:flavin reductase (DIM6/NTAB) family NADH-FMN oxidoreductase RutF